MSARPGFVLVVSLVVLVALALLGAGMMALGTRELLIAAEAERIARVGRDAESAVRRGLARWSTRDALALPVLEARTLAGASAPVGETGARVSSRIRVELERLDTTLFLLRAEAEAPGGRRAATVGRAAALVRTLDPRELAAAFPAAITADSGLVGEGTVSGIAGCAAPSAPFEIPATVPALRSPGTLIVEPGATIAGEPPRSFDTVPPLPAPLTEPLLPALATALVDPGEAAPRPRTSGGTCEADPGNWGGVSPAGPCHHHLPLVLARGPLGVQRGEGRGILVVQGDLRIGGSFRFEGLVLVSGRLTIEGDARVRGAVRAGVVDVRGGRVDHDGCAVRDASFAPALDRAFRPRPGIWVPAF